MNRSNVREAIQNAKVETLQGTVAFDPNGDILDSLLVGYYQGREVVVPEEEK